MFFIALIGPCRFNSYSVCDECGAIRRASERQLPFVQISYWTTERIEPSALDDLQLAPQHDHHWVFGHGGGNGVSCALGEGRHSVSVLSNPLIHEFLANSHEYAGVEDARGWLAAILKDGKGDRVVIWLAETGFPATGFSNGGDYEQWRADAGLTWERYAGD